MTIAKKLLASALLTFSTLAPGLAHADFHALAFGSDGYGNPGTGKTQVEANWEALKACNEGNPKKDCELKFTKAVVMFVNPQDNDLVGYVPAGISVEAGIARALKLCAKPGCKIEKVTTTPGYWALAKSKNKSGTGQTYLTHGYDNFDEARAAAVKRCEELTEFQCERVWSGVIAGELKLPAKATPSK